MSDLKKLNKVLDELNATQVERTSIIHSAKLGHNRFLNGAKVTTEDVQREINRIALKD